MLGEQRHRSHDHAGRAVAALEPVVLSERLLHRMHPFARRETLDRRDLGAVGLHREHGARLHRLSVEQHRARAARRGVTTHVGAREAAHLAQVVHEQQSRLDVVVVARAVDREGDSHGSHHACHAEDIRLVWRSN